MSYLQIKPAAKAVQLRSTPAGSLPAGSLPAGSSPVSMVYQDFVTNTSLLGVQHFLRNKSLFWLLAYLTCVTMSIVQSMSVTEIFFQEKTFNWVTMASKNPMPFPSVTICTHTVLRHDYNFSLIPGFNVEVYKELLETCADIKSLKKKRSIAAANTQAVLEYLRTFSNEERYKLGLDLNKVISFCAFGPNICNTSILNDLYLYSDPWFGNCFTFNPAFNDSMAKYAETEDLLFLNLKFPSRGFWLTHQSKASLGLQIHPAGTAPLIEAPNVEQFFGDVIQNIVIELESERISLKKTTTSIPSCVDSDDPVYRRRNVHHSEKSPYRYSQTACLKTCTEESFSECGLIHPFTPLQSKEYEKGKKLTYVAIGCDLKPVTMEACNCPVPCSKSEYEVRRAEYGQFNIQCDVEPSPVLSSKSESKDEGDYDSDYDNEVTLYIKFGSNIFQKVEEQFCYGLSEYLGILGGNMSLWIGLCIISLLEVVELITKLIIAAFQSKPQSKQPRRHFRHAALQRRPEMFRPPRHGFNF